MMEPITYLVYDSFDMEPEQATEVRANCPEDAAKEWAEWGELANNEEYEENNRRVQVRRMDGIEWNSYVIEVHYKAVYEAQRLDKLIS